jgi:hypothetical protein
VMLHVDLLCQQANCIVVTLGSASDFGQHAHFFSSKKTLLRIHAPHVMIRVVVCDNAHPPLTASENI